MTTCTDDYVNLTVKHLMPTWFSSFRLLVCGLTRPFLKKVAFESRLPLLGIVDDDPAAFAVSKNLQFFIVQLLQLEFVGDGKYSHA